MALGSPQGPGQVPLPGCWHLSAQPAEVVTFPLQVPDSLLGAEQLLGGHTDLHGMETLGVGALLPLRRRPGVLAMTLHPAQPEQVTVTL